MAQLWLLIWKNWLLTKRNFLVEFVQILVSVVLVMTLVAYNRINNPTPFSKDSTGILPRSSIPLHENARN